MAIKIAPELEPPPTRTQSERRRSDGWFTKIQRRVKLAMSGDDEELLVVNNTTISWHVYHTFHLLGIIDAGEMLTFRLQKRGNLNVRPSQESDATEYLVLDLTSQIQRVEIYRRNIGPSIDVYEMRAA
jgi:hypothetical protein